MTKAKTATDGSGKIKPKGKPRGKANPQNLKPFKPGQSGNPNGQPRGEKFETTLNRYLEKDAADVIKLIEIAATKPLQLKGIPFQDALILRTLGAFSNDPNGAFFTTLRETKEGKLKETMDVNVNDVDAEIRRELARLAGTAKDEDAPTASSDANPDQGQAA
jgi:hypothetical protein